METLHSCKDSGYLLGPARFIPDDPAEFYSGKERIVIGCTRLRCSVCHQLARVERDPLPEGQDFRTYQCGHLVHRETGPSRTPDLDDPDTGERPLPWACAGHPPATLPFDLDGVSIARESDFDALLRRTLGGWSPEAARPGERASPIGWAVKLYARLLDTGSEDAVSRAVAACFDDPEPRVRSAALEFFAVWPHAAGGERVEELFSGDRSLFEGVADPSGTAAETLETRLLRALGARACVRDAEGAPRSPRALQLARFEALRSDKSVALYSALSIVDPDWLAQHAAEIAATGPQAWYWLMVKLPGDQVPEAATRLAGLPVVDAQELRELVELRVGEGDARRASILALLDRRQRGRRG